MFTGGIADEFLFTRKDQESRHTDLHLQWELLPVCM